MSYPSEGEESRPDIKIYGAHWCGDCRRAEHFFDLHQVPYTWIDVDSDPAALDYIRELQNGGQSIPTKTGPFWLSRQTPSWPISWV